MSMYMYIHVTHDYCVGGIRVISIPATLKSVKYAVILVQRAQPTAEVVVYWIHLHGA